MCIAGTNTQLVFFRANHESFHAFFYNQAVNAFMCFIWMCLCHHQINTGSATIGNPVFSAIE